jgi:hypothetical protein
MTEVFIRSNAFTDESLSLQTTTLWSRNTCTYLTSLQTYSEGVGFDWWFLIFIPSIESVLDGLKELVAKVDPSTSSNWKQLVSNVVMLESCCFVLQIPMTYLL